MKLDDIDREIIRLLQGDIPLETRPFVQLAEQLGATESEIVARIAAMRANGQLRRWGAVLRHHQAGYTANAMVAWRAKPDQADQAGEIMAAFKEISHCYLRQVPEDFGYSLFTMVHARSAAELDALIGQISLQSGLSDYAVIKSLQELKKASVQYVDL